MSDNRQRPRIHRCDDKHDALIRAYAERHGIKPWQALETAIGRLKDPDGPAIDRLTKERAPEIRSAPALPADFETKVRARAKAHGQTIERTRERVIELGFSRYDALAKAKGGRAP